MTSVAAFDRVAARYEELWSGTAIGRRQRDAVWRRLGMLFSPGQRVLDIGCGIGDDAIWLQDDGIEVDAIDASPEMVAVARRRSVAARVAMCGDLSGQFDGVVSNFGALNCMPLAEWSGAVGRLVKPGGTLAICVLNKFCLWESLWFVVRGQFRKAMRRWSGSSAWGDMTIHYPSKSQMVKALLPSFRLVSDVGIGIAVPPSFVTGLPDDCMRRLAEIDRLIESVPGFRGIGDHRLLVFRKK